MIKKIKHKKLIAVVSAILIIIAAIAILEEVIEPSGYIRPDYQKEDISIILEKETFTEEDYKQLFYQTGLGKTAVDELIKKSDGKSEIIKFQEIFFRDNEVLCEPIGIITSQESIVNDE